VPASPSRLKMPTMEPALWISISCFCARIIRMKVC
jgi:hypothetical protein